MNDEITATPLQRAKSHAVYQAAVDVGLTEKQLAEVAADLEKADRASTEGAARKIGDDLIAKIEGWRFAAHVARHTSTDRNKNE